MYLIVGVGGVAAANTTAPASSREVEKPITMRGAHGVYLHILVLIALQHALLHFLSTYLSISVYILSSSYCFLLVGPVFSSSEESNSEDD